MRGSIERVRAVINGDQPDRAPLYELLRNDAVISHFAGEQLTIANAERVVYRAYEPAVDATRPSVKLPDEPGTVQLQDGRLQQQFRWTTWTEHVRYADSQAYAGAKRAELARLDGSWTAQDQQRMSETLAANAENRSKLGEVFFFPAGAGPGLMGIIGEIGLEQFSYYLADCGDIIVALLEAAVAKAVLWIEHLPEDHDIEAVFMGDDIAFKSGPMLSPAWLKANYFHRLERIVSAYHARGVKVLFHSDGNLMSILDDLVAAGIDGLNPIEVLADMDVATIHRRHPELFIAGAIDVSQLLPFGTAQQVKDTVRRTIDAAEGRIMIGSTTELNNEVPLENYLALREAVLEA
jgi:hypothetical protein